MSEQRVYTEDEERMFCAWSDYRSEYGVSARRMTEAHAEFTAGWRAGLLDHTVDLGNATMEFKAGYDAYWGRLDIGGVMR